jgi:hypothetical protein
MKLTLYIGADPASRTAHARLLRLFSLARPDGVALAVRNTAETPLDDHEQGQVSFVPCLSRHQPEPALHWLLDNPSYTVLIETLRDAGVALPEREIDEFLRLIDRPLVDTQ